MAHRALSGQLQFTNGADPLALDGDRALIPAGNPVQHAVEVPQFRPTRRPRKGPYRADVRISIMPFAPG